MGFPDLSEEAGIKALNSWLATRSYIESYSPSQADIACFQAINSAPSSAQYPHAARWYNHIVCYEAEFSALAGDAAKSFQDYGPALAVAKDNSFDLSESDGEDDDEATLIREQRLADYKARKAAKPKTIAKSVVILDIKPWNDETDMAALEAAVRSINRDGLVWGTSKLIAVGYGIKKLQLTVVVEDDKISTQDLQDEIEVFDEHVQSSDIVTFQKL